MPLTYSNLSTRLGQKLKIFRDFGFALKPQSVILDFGCGSGKYVQELRLHGYQAYGCDIEMKSEDNVDTDSMVKNNVIRKIDLKNYILPFEDNTFDLIFSDQVFEHVQNYPETIAEISRVLKPGGSCLHIFPSRYKLIESHIFIPFSSVIKTYWWVSIWVFLGIRNEWQNYKTRKDLTERYFNYLNGNTNYLSRRDLNAQFRSHFRKVTFCENKFLKFSQRGKFIFPVIKVLPFIPVAYSTFRSRVILTQSPY